MKDLGWNPAKTFAWEVSVKPVLNAMFSPTWQLIRRSIRVSVNDSIQDSVRNITAQTVYEFNDFDAAINIKQKLVKELIK